MIQAKIIEKYGRVVGYEVSGHANSGEYGHDIVCAAVSVLAITTANNLYKMIAIKPEAKMADGYVSVRLPVSISKKQDEIAQTLMTGFKNAIADVVEEYEDYIEVSTEKISNQGEDSDV